LPLPRPGPRNLITDVPGLTVGHATDEAVRTGVTALLCPEGWVGAVDVRGGGPGIRESDVLRPENNFSRAHAITLSGGSVFGLGAADGVVAALSAAGHGLRLAAGSPAIPIVPGAVLHDLGNGGDKAWGLDPPYRALGLAAVAAAGEDFALGSVGAGPRGDGGRSQGRCRLGLAGPGRRPDCRRPGGGQSGGFGLHARRRDVLGLAVRDRRRVRRGAPDPATRAVDPVPDDSKLAALGRFNAGANTTLAVVATTAALTTAEATRLAMMAQDGLARAVRPVHTPFDGDVVFALSSGAVVIGEGPARSLTIARLGSAAADTLARAIARGVFEAR
jgi:L-aminopeptidase/D-esterase-like protein